MWSAIRRQWRRFAVLAFVASLAMAATVAGSAVSSFSAANAESVTGDTSLLTRISIYNDTSVLPFSTVKEVGAMTGVSSVEPVIRVPAGIEDTKSSVILVSVGGEADVPIVEGAIPEAGLAENQIILPANVDGVDMRQFLGKQIALTYTIGITAESGTTKNLPLTVVALFDPSYQIDAPIAGYVTLAVARQLAAHRAGVTEAIYEESMGVDRIDIRARTVADVPLITKALQDKGLHAISEIQRAQQVPGVIDLLQSATTVLFVVLLALAVGTASLIANSIATEREREIAVLRACGWSHLRVLGVLLGEATIVVTVATIVGALAGTIVANTVGESLRDELGGGSLGQMAVPWAVVIMSGVILVLFVALAYALAVTRTTRRPISVVLQGAQ